VSHAALKAGRLTPLDVPDIDAGRRIAGHFQLPYSVVEFRRSHDLAHPGSTFELPQAYIDALARLSGITQVIVMPSKSRYVGRDQGFPGPGARVLPRTPDAAAALPDTACSPMDI
jgi:hypothetical protein